MTAMPTLVLDLSREAIERLNESIDRKLKRDPDPETMEEVIYLTFRTFGDLVWSWNRLVHLLDSGMPGPMVRQTLLPVIRMFDEWLQLAHHSKKMARSVQSLSVTDAVRKNRGEDIERIDRAVETILSAVEEARSILAMMDSPLSDSAPARLAEAEELYAQGRFVNFKEAIARCRANRA